MSQESVMFQWDYNEIEKYIIAKQKIEETQVSIRIAQKLKEELGYDPKILEAGSGNGCVVIIFDRLGFKNIQGIELNSDIVKDLNRAYPDLKIVSGNILNLDENLKNNDLVLSLGVVEHFIDGPSLPLKSMYDALKLGGYAVITVPCLNFFRKLNKIFDKNTKKLIKKSNTNFKYYPFFWNNKFHEYHMTIQEFEKECKNAGFDIIEHLPSEENLGIMHIINPKNKKGNFIWYEELEEYRYSLFGKLILLFAKYFPFTFSHFQVCVLKKTQ